MIVVVLLILVLRNVPLVNQSDFRSKNFERVKLFFFLMRVYFFKEQTVIL